MSTESNKKKWVKPELTTIETIDKNKHPENEWVDILNTENYPSSFGREIKIHEHGSITLIDVMPRMVPKGSTADFAIVQAARVSYGAGLKTYEEDRDLIRYLMRHDHTSPFEMVEFKFRMVLPIFVARQIVRHRTANINEYSGRYSQMPNQFYRPYMHKIRAQGKINKQGSEGTIDKDIVRNDFMTYMHHCDGMFDQYEGLVDRGVSKELARIGLPLNTYTKWFWKCDLRNILHFLKLRMDEHAQEETRDYANAMFALIAPIVPITIKAFIDYELESVKLSREEIEALRDGNNGKIENKLEMKEFENKMNKIFPNRGVENGKGS